MLIVPRSDRACDYTIGDPIGFGASSIVYTALWKPADDPDAKPIPCALKVLDLDTLPPRSLSLLQRETTLMSLSKHPNVLRVRGSWMEGHKLYIALRLMNKGSAADVMRYGWPGGMEEEVVKCILRQALKGLKYVVHPVFALLWLTGITATSMSTASFTETSRQPICSSTTMGPSFWAIWVSPRTSQRIHTIIIRRHRRLARGLRLLQPLHLLSLGASTQPERRQSQTLLALSLESGNLSLELYACPHLSSSALSANLPVALLDGAGAHLRETIRCGSGHLELWYHRNRAQPRSSPKVPGITTKGATSNVRFHVTQHQVLVLTTFDIRLQEDSPSLDRQGGTFKYSRAFKEMVDSCLAKDPSKRYVLCLTVSPCSSASTRLHAGLMIDAPPVFLSVDPPPSSS